MPRVTRSTLLSAATCCLLVAAGGTGLAGCGGSDTDSDAKATTTATTPIKRSQSAMPQVLDSKVAVTEEGQKAIDAASTKTVSATKLKAATKSLMALLKKAGLAPTLGGDGTHGPAVIQLDNTTVMLYPSEQQAASQAASFIRVIDTAKTDGRVARYGRVVIATSAPDGMDAALKREFKKAVKAVKQASV
ncbi:MAG: hypothetical protein QM679_06005 [Patulibacter sp.]